RHDSGYLSLYMMLVAIAFGVFDFFALTLWQQAAKNQVHRIKLLFFRSIIHQDISWFDTKTSGDFATKITGCVGISLTMSDLSYLTLDLSFSAILTWFKKVLATRW